MPDSIGSDALLSNKLWQGRVAFFGLWMGLTTGLK